MWWKSSKQPKGYILLHFSEASPIKQHPYEHVRVCRSWWRESRIFWWTRSIRSLLEKNRPSQTHSNAEVSVNVSDSHAAVSSSGVKVSSLEILPMSMCWKTALIKFIFLNTFILPMFIARSDEWWWIRDWSFDILYSERCMPVGWNGLSLFYWQWSNEFTPDSRGDICAIDKWRP